MQFLVMVRRTATGYSVDVPDLPGCVSTAKTVEGALRRIRRSDANAPGIDERVRRNHRRRRDGG